MPEPDTYDRKTTMRVFFDVGNSTIISKTVIVKPGEMIKIPKNREFIGISWGSEPPMAAALFKNLDNPREIAIIRTSMNDTLFGTEGIIAFTELNSLIGIKAVGVQFIETEN